MALARGALPSSSAPCLHLHVTAQCLSGHHVSSPMSQLARLTTTSRDRPMHGDLIYYLHGWISTRRCRFLFSIAYSEGKKRNRAGGQRLAAWLRVGYATESAHEPAAKVSPPCRARPLNYVHVAGAEFFSRASPGNEREPAAADSQSQACDRRQLPKCQRATASS